MAINPQAFKTGQFIPRHPEKYVGDVNNIMFRSSWEEEYCYFCDNNTEILQWAYEEISIKYIHPGDGKLHNYFPDFWIKRRTQDGNIIREIVEIKPYKQTQPATRRGKRRKQQLFESNTFAVNVAKWNAAQYFCNKYNMIFRIVTERDLFGEIGNVNSSKRNRINNRAPTRKSPRTNTRNHKCSSSASRNRVGVRSNVRRKR